MANGGSGTGVGGGAPGGPGDTGEAAGEGGIVDGGGGGSYAEQVSNQITTDVSKAKTATPVAGNKSNVSSSGYFSLDDYAKENFDPMGSAHKGTHSYYGGVNTVGDKIGSRFSAWEQEDPEAKDYSPPVTQFSNFMSVDQLEALREKARNTPPQGVNIMGFNVGPSQLMGLVNPVGGIAVSAVDAFMNSMGFPNIGPHMTEKDRDWADARWADDFDPAQGARVDSQGNVVSGPTSPAGGEVITVAAPPGAPDQRVTQFKALYPTDWTETLTDEEILEMVENPDQLRFWLSWRQT